MAVKDFMTKRVVYVSPETTVAVAADIMREKGLRRLPVIEHDKLVAFDGGASAIVPSVIRPTSLSCSITGKRRKPLSRIMSAAVATVVSGET